MNNVIIRPVVEEDFEALRPVMKDQTHYHADLIPEIINKIEMARENDLKWFRDALDNPNKHLFCAELDGDLVGMTLFEIKQSSDDPIMVKRRYLYIDELNAVEGMRGKGIGKALMDAVHAWARENGISEIELNVWERNQPAIGFYEQMGYQSWRRTMRIELRVDL